jgi:hypothetical protein
LISPFFARPRATIGRVRVIAWVALWFAAACGCGAGATRTPIDWNKVQFCPEASPIARRQHPHEWPAPQETLPLEAFQSHGARAPDPNVVWDHVTASASYPRDGQDERPHAAIILGTENNDRLFEWTNGTWRELTPPESIRTRSRHEMLLLGVGDTFVAVVVGQRLQWFERGAWHARNLELPPAGIQVLAERASAATAADGRRVYFTVEAGEWGNDFLSFEIDKGPMRRELESMRDGMEIKGMEVRGVRRDPNGRLWALLGESRSFYEGALLRLDRGSWSLVAATRAHTIDGEMPCKVNWPWIATSFNGLDFDRQGRPVLWTPDGLYRLEPSGAWTPVRIAVPKEYLDPSE